MTRRFTQPARQQAPQQARQQAQQKSGQKNGKTAPQQPRLHNRQEAARAIFDIDTFWAKSFADTTLNDLNYCDLFTQMWLMRNGEGHPKTDLYELMPNISRRTAVKYLQRAIEQGMLEEVECQEDRRIRLVSLSPRCVEKVQRFLDYTCERFRDIG